MSWTFESFLRIFSFLRRQNVSEKVIYNPFHKWDYSEGFVCIVVIAREAIFYTVEKYRCNIFELYVRLFRCAVGFQIFYTDDNVWNSSVHLIDKLFRSRNFVTIKISRSQSDRGCVESLEISCMTIDSTNDSHNSNKLYDGLGTFCRNTRLHRQHFTFLHWRVRFKISVIFSIRILQMFSSYCVYLLWYINVHLHYSLGPYISILHCLFIMEFIVLNKQCTLIPCIVTCFSKCVLFFI